METTETIETSESVVQETAEPVTQTEVVTPKLRETKIEVDGRQMAINEAQLKALWGLPRKQYQNAINA